MGFRTLAIQQRSSEVWKVLGTVKTEFGKFAEVLANTKRQLQTVANTIDQAEVRTRQIERKLKDVEALPDGQENLPLEDERPVGDLVRLPKGQSN
jgi:DNA recombination protein RmuC